MKKAKLVRVTEVEIGPDQETEKYEYISTSHDWKIGGEPGDRTIVTEAGEVTLDELVQYLDSDAEGANYHEFVGVHEWMGAAIKKFASEEVAIKVLRLVAEYGGLVEVNDDAAARKEVGL